MSLIRIEMKNNIDSAIRESKRELLPDEIQKNYLTSWILSFDVLEKHGQSDDHWQQNKDILIQFIAKICQNSLTPNISFYFASMFHIGRQWQVSEQAVKTVEKAMKETNLKATVALNINLFKNQFQDLDIQPDDQRVLLSDSLIQILDFAKYKHLQKIKKSQEWWMMWNIEVKELKDIVDIYSQEYYKSYNEHEHTGILRNLVRLVTFSFQTKNLYKVLNQEGIKFKNISISNTIQNPFDPLSLLFLMLNERNGREYIYEFRHLLEAQKTLLDAQRYTPIIQQAESKLLKLFDDENPFEKYTVLKSPPDLRLKELWNKCKLPKDEMFYYAKNWLDSLEPSANFRYNELHFKSPLNDKDVENYARYADSTIKRKWISESRLIGKTDDEHIQYLFEHEWIVEMIKGATYLTKEKKGFNKWNVDNLRDMIDEVAKFLNKISGYSLETPNKIRFESLWDLAIKGNLYSSTEW